MGCGSSQSLDPMLMLMYLIDSGLQAAASTSSALTQEPCTQGFLLGASDMQPASNKNVSLMRRISWAFDV